MAMPRLARIALAALCAGYFAACSGDGTESRAPARPDGGENDEREDGGEGEDDAGEGPSGSDMALVRLEIQGLTGNEGAMEVRYVVADELISRADESAIPRPAPLQYCTTVGSSGSCDISLPVGKSVTFYAYEGYAGSYYVTTSGILPLPEEAHEFVSFEGDCSGTGVLRQGDCGLRAESARTYEVRAEFTSMPEFRVEIHGATAFDIELEVRDLLQLPVQNRTPPRGAGGGTTGSPSVIAQAWFPFGTETTLTAKATNMAQFLRWEGCKTGTGGTDPVCVVAQSTSGGAPAVVRLFHEYWLCPNGAVGDGRDVNCTKQTP
jgi:hypothetical protein